MAEGAKLSRLARSRKNLVRLFKEIRGELKKVVWPNRDQLINNLITVLLSCLLIGAILWVADGLLDIGASALFTR